MQLEAFRKEKKSIGICLWSKLQS